MNRNIDKIYKLALANIIDDVLKTVTYNFSLLTNKGKLEEPDYIASLCLEFVNELYNILNNNFRGYSFSTTGIFCHQKPITNFNSGSCEIGDLLMFYVYRDVKGIKYYNSLLLQAKISEHEKLNLPQNDDQLKLYSKWPRFYYTRAGKLNKTNRDIIPKTFTSGAKYLLIDPDINVHGYRNSNEYIYGTAIADNPLVLSNQFSMELLDLITFKAGRKVEEAPTNDEWSQLIWDIIKITENSRAKRINIKATSFSRRKEAGNFFYYTQNQNTYLNFFDNISDNNVKNNDIFKEFDDESGGLPLIIIECQEHE
jgi:hypothetical protein